MLDNIRQTRLALQAPLANPIDNGFRSASARPREAFKLYANVRGRYDHIDMALVRENTDAHRASILKALIGLFLETARAVGQKYQDRLEIEDRIVDNIHATGHQPGPI